MVDERRGKSFRSPSSPVPWGPDAARFRDSDGRHADDRGDEDVPQLSRPWNVVVHDETRAHQGIVILPTTGDGQQLYMGVDPEGYVVWYKQTGFLGDQIGGDVKQLDNGRLFIFRPGGVQIIEPWGERVWGGDRERQANGKLPPVGNTVDVANAVWTNTIGATELITVWEDPDFDASERAFYYVRVIEIPTPRWTAYEAKRYQIDMPDEVPMITQERAYTSPIWYTP